MKGHETWVVNLCWLQNVKFIHENSFVAGNRRLHHVFQRTKQLPGRCGWIPPNHQQQEDYTKEALNMLAEVNFMPSGQFSVLDAEIIAYIRGHMLRKVRDKLCAVCQRKLSGGQSTKPKQLFISLKEHSHDKESLTAPSTELP